MNKDSVRRRGRAIHHQSGARSNDHGMTERKALAPVLVGLCVLIACACPAIAQRPERQQEVRVPGIGVPLKAGWQLLIQGGCRFAVPRFWQTTADGSAAFSGDGNTLSVSMLKITDWSTHKAHVKDAFGRVNIVHEDSDRRLWFEVDDKQRIEHYVDVANGASACVGVLEIRAATALSADDANRIADSVGPAPVHWPPDPK